MKPIIRVENLSKEYLLGANQTPYSTLRESLMSAVKFPVKAFLRRGSANEQNKLWALKDVGFEIMPGEVVGIIGRNGAGKSTLLKILSRITEPTSGKIDLYGRVGSLLEVGTGFHPELTGRENIYLNGAILGMQRTEITKKFDEIVDFSEIEKFIDTPVKFYSSGMYTRLAFAVAANLEPEILIVDEVLAVGDAEFQKKCLGKMKSVSDREGRTVLFVSHNITAVESLCTKGIFLKNGKVIEKGKIKSVINTYLTKEVTNNISKEWADLESAPGNDSVRLKRIEVVPQLETGDNEIRVNTPINIEFEFWNLLPNEQDLNLSIVLWTVSGECIFNVTSNLLNASPGICRGKLKIPANFLNDNNYSIEIYIIKGSSAVFRGADLVSFEVHDLERNGEWYGKWIGAVRPKFEFEFSQTESSKPN